MSVIEAPESGVKVRMYRQGHGDCFLLVFRDDDGDPFYMLVDCGYKPGSSVHHSIQEVVDDIRDATGNRLDVVLITHEHQDHVNGFWQKTGNNITDRFVGFDIGHLWLAWTEDPADDLANQLRDKYNDTLLGLMAAQERLAAVGAGDPAASALADRIEELLEFEIEGPREEFLALAVAGITNKLAIKSIREKTGRNPLYLRPDRDRYWLPNVSGVSLYALGPPRDETLLKSLEPLGPEEYSRHFAAARDAESFIVAARRPTPAGAPAEVAGETWQAHQPFATRFRIAEDAVGGSDDAGFFEAYYASGDGGRDESWRRIDSDWLQTAEALALRLNSEVNNTSLVTAIELPNTKRVILMTGDAQRGSWISWDDQTWQNEESETVTARDLLGRTVLYKVGHHGSHNATLKGYAGSDYANLSWMARDEYRDEFVAMIPANRPWAYEKKHWKHPLRSIERALLRKAKGRVFRTDEDSVDRGWSISTAQWDEFQSRTTETPMYFEYLVPDPA